jgi:two-component sensor histidine kinase
MVFHELATNAAKYGALSTGEGTVSVTWRLMIDGQKRLSIQWQELKGPPVLSPQRRGFGSIVVERMALQISDSSASLKYISAGVIWYLEAPLDSFVSPASSEFGDPHDVHQGLADYVGSDLKQRGH